MALTQKQIDGLLDLIADPEAKDEHKNLAREIIKGSIVPEKSEQNVKSGGFNVIIERLRKVEKDSPQPSKSWPAPPQLPWAPYAPQLPHYGEPNYPTYPQIWC